MIESRDASICVQAWLNRAGQSLAEALLAKTRQLLAGCTCDSACHKCLKHYRNQYIHSALDRKSALDLLDWGETGSRAPALSGEQQKSLLRPLERLLPFSGWICRAARFGPKAGALGKTKGGGYCLCE
ncbi:hypothetical protein D1159_01185 [Pseudoflavonifractor sp. 524-17]|nr:hypothetical protein [Pseudoflavonifractor sp. 524-17]